VIASSGACGELWDRADDIAVSRLAYIEAVAALAQATRMGRISADNLTDTWAALDGLWSEVNVIELDQELMTEAARLAVLHGLRGYDAAHCAAAVFLNGPGVVAASGDARLLAGWQAEGIAVRDVNV